MAEIGLILKQFDGLETAGRPWEACEGNACYCQGATMPGRVSAMIAYRGLSEREDREGIPLPFEGRAGVVLRNSEVSFECMYGIDGATFNLKDPRHPGCTAEMCDTSGDGLCQHGTRADDCAHGDMCGFTGAPPTAFHPRDMKLLLEMHAKYREPWLVALLFDDLLAWNDWMATDRALGPLGLLVKSRGLVRYAGVVNDLLGEPQACRL